jgi:tetratricopeptide (TPR) repeat protein
MLATSRTLLYTIPATLLFSVACWGQTTSLEGDVKGEDGKPIQNAVVKIDRKDIKGAYKTKTDKKGHFFHAGLPIGTYRVALEVDNQEKDSVDNVRTKLGDPTPVNFDLKAASARAGAVPAGGPSDAERGMTAAQKADYEKKKKEQEAAMSKNKELNDAFNAGKEAVIAKNWDAAIDAFQKAAVVDQGQHVVYGNLADAYIARAAAKTGAESQADLDKGIEAYQKAIELKQDDPAYHNNYALALAKEKKFAEAQTELTKAAQLDPTNAGKYYYNLGAVYVNTGNMEPAGEAFKKAIELDPNYPDAHYQYGIYLIGKATTTPDGKINPPPGTAEEFQKYLQLNGSGQFADAAKAMLQSIGSSVETQFSAPGQKKQAPKKQP